VLSDRERQELHEIEHGFLIQDPGFWQSFNAEAQRVRHGGADLTTRLYTILLALSAMFMTLFLMRGSPTSAVVLGVVVALTWRAGRRRNNAPQEKPRDPG
jgi:hypothetical protein